MKAGTLHCAISLLLTIIPVSTGQGRSSAESPRDTGILIETPTDTVHLATAHITESPFFVEGSGSFTTSTGTVIDGQWGGFSLPGLLSSLDSLRPDDSVVFIAADGYEMTNSGREILDESEGTWILAFTRNAASFSGAWGVNRTIKVGPTRPSILGHTSVRDVVAIRIDRIEYRDFSFTVRGLRRESLDRQTVQSCVGCHGVKTSVTIKGELATYAGVPLHRFLAYADDSLYIPHAQDQSIESYQAGRAQMGYTVRVFTADGDSISFDSRLLHTNDRIILGYYRNSRELPVDEIPLVLVREMVPESTASQIWLPNIAGMELSVDQEE